MNFFLAFPKLIICLNTQISLRKIQKYYPKKAHLFETSIPFLFGSYGDNHGEHFKEFMRKNRTELNVENLETFLNITKPEMKIIACKFLNSEMA